MRKVVLGILAFVSAYFSATFVMAGTPFFHKIWDVSSTGSVDISTSTLTRVPPASVGNDSRREGILIDNLASNTGNMRVFITSTTSLGFGTTQAGTTIRAIDEPSFVPIAGNLYLYVLSLHTSSETLSYQELR